MDQCSFGRKRLKACIRRNSLKEVDCISEMPDDILINIVSLLTLKEAGRTSVLSKRWRYVWAYTPYLNFDASKIIKEWRLLETVYESDVCRYYNWVDQAVRSHKASTIDEFRVSFDLHKNRQEKIDNWLKFATEKRVKRLELNIAPFEMSYTFPSCISLCCNSLTSLELTHVDVTGEVLENFLSNCQTLESLSVDSSESLVSLIVAGTSLNLKYLKIIYCRELKHLEITAPNLTSCYYAGPQLQAPMFKSTPKLSKLYIGGTSGVHQFSSFSDISSCISVIEDLTLEAPYKLERVAKLFPVCLKLKQLHVRVDPRSDKELFGLRFLLKACPCLEKFVLKFRLSGLDLKRIRPKNVEACSFDNLKVLEIVEFVDWIVVTKFVEYLIKNAVSLEKITIKPIIKDGASPYQSVPRAEEKARQLFSKFNKPGRTVEIR